MLRKFFKESAGIDYILLLSVLFLIILGLVMISSVSVFESYSVTQDLVKKGLRSVPSNDFYLIRSIMYSIFALGVGILGFLIPVNLWEKTSKIIFGISLVLLLLTFTYYGNKLGGATAWLDIPGLPSIQPVEIYKLGLILYLSYWLNKKSDVLHSFEDGFLPYFARVGIFIFPLALQPDFGSILVIIPITMCLYIIAGGSVRYLLYVIAMSFLCAIIVIISFSYIRNRVEVFLNPESDPTNKGVGWQIEQSLIAVGSGGLAGRGVGNSIQKFGYLPQVQGDSIFAAIAEEMGFIRLLFILGCFMIIAYRGMQVSLRNASPFGTLVCAGITIWITVQALINIGVNLNLVPLTGITLPFISYGGSSMVSLCLAVGILLAYSRDLQPVYEDHFYRRGDPRSRYPSTYSSTYTKRQRNK